MKPPVLGVITQNLTSEIRQSIGSNKGVYVIAVIKNSPAFRADILQRDILLKINNVELYDAESFHNMIGSFAGQKVIVEILRGGKEIKKEIQLGLEMVGSKKESTIDKQACEKECNNLLNKRTT